MWDEFVRFFREGGVMILLMVVTGSLAFAWSASFAYRPTDKKRQVTVAFLRTTVYAGWFGFFAGMTAMVRALDLIWQGKAPWQEKEPMVWWQILIEGSSEASANLMMAVAWLALVWLFLAVGEARTKTA